MSFTEKLGIICICIVAFQIIRSIFKFLYNNFISIALRINGVKLKETGKWAGKFKMFNIYKNSY